MAKQKLFRVNVREVHIQGYLVKAASEKAAKQKVVDGGGDLCDDSFEYSHTLDPEDWTVEEEI